MINIRVCCLIGIMGGLIGTVSNIFLSNWPAVAWAFGSACWAFLGWRLEVRIQDLLDANYNKFILGK